MKNLNEENVVSVLCNLVGNIIYENNNLIQVKSEYTDKIISFSNIEILKVYEECASIIHTDELSFATKNVYEIVIKDVNSNFGFRNSKELFSVEDIENRINYKIDFSSFKFILVQLDRLMDYEDYEKILSLQLPRMFLRRRFEEIEGDEIGIYDFLKNSFFRNQTIQIKSEKERSINEFNELISSYVFQISYNYNTVLVPQKNIQDLFKRRGILIRQRNRFSEIEKEFDPPRRKYISELISYYQMAMASESPYLEFISYYHVIEYFFDTVFNDELVNKIREKITMPTFSYKRKKDLLDLVKLVLKLSSIGNDGMVHNELNALTLTLKKYIDITDLRKEIENQDKNYINYLKTEKVLFSNGNTVNLNNNDFNCVYKELANRIYITRNALIHSKELENSKYQPFHDDKVLLKEMLLLRLIAEQLIIRTSQVL